MLCISDDYGHYCPMNLKRLVNKLSYLLSRVQLFPTPSTVAREAPPYMEFLRQLYQSGLPFPSPWYLPDPGIEPRLPAL